MAITKTIFKRQCPRGYTTTRVEIGFHGNYIDKDILYNKIEEIIEKICPDPNGTVSMKEFYKQIFEYLNFNFEKEKNKVVKKSLKHMLLEIIEASGDNADVLFVKEVSVEERNRLGFLDAIIVN